MCTSTARKSGRHAVKSILHPDSFVSWNHLNLNSRFGVQLDHAQQRKQYFTQFVTHFPHLPYSSVMITARLSVLRFNCQFLILSAPCKPVSESKLDDFLLPCNGKSMRYSSNLGTGGDILLHGGGLARSMHRWLIRRIFKRGCLYRALLATATTVDLLCGDIEFFF